MSRKERNIRRTLFFFGLGIIVILLCGSLSARGQPKDVREYQIGQGDTLWGIAEECKPNDVTYREYIDMLYKLNDGLSAEIYPGEVILVPVWEE